MSQQATQLHQDMICLFEKELVLDVLLVIGQEMELPENSQYNLLMMEILHHILKRQDPMAVARGMATQGSIGLDKDATSLSIRKSVRGETSTSSSLLTSTLNREKDQLRALATIRHGHFGGTWMKKGEKRHFISASAAVLQRVVDPQSNNLVQARRKHRMAEPFIGSGKSMVAHTQLPAADRGPATKRANETLNLFCTRFMVDCYGPFMKSLKNEFRRDSVRLEESDTLILFRLIWFFSQWWRASSSTRATSTSVRDATKEVIGRLIITMDVFTFNLVLNATESFYNHKKHARLAQTVALYNEMIHVLNDMYFSRDKTEHEMAMGLIDRLFYGQEALDQISKLISYWSPGTYTREYLCDLVGIIHVSLTLLEENAKKGIEFVETNVGNGSRDVSQKIAKMRSTAAGFDIKSYFVRKIVSNKMIFMYCHILSQYKVNATLVNHRIIALFQRLIRVEITSPYFTDFNTPLKLQGKKGSTLQPMLYNLQMILTMEQILNDASIRDNEDFESLIQFSASLMYKLWAAAETNPMLYIECLFRHVTPPRFCELVTNMYVNDDLRMIAERASLLEEQQINDESDDNWKSRMERQLDRDDDEEELEFVEDAATCSRAGSEEAEPRKVEVNVEASEGFEASDSRESRRKRGRDDEDLYQQQSYARVKENINVRATKVTRKE
jgi:timeless